MHLTISTDDGSVLGELDAAPESMWRDLLLYVSGLWLAAGPVIVANGTTVKRAVPGVLALCLALTACPPA